MQSEMPDMVTSYQRIYVPDWKEQGLSPKYNVFYQTDQSETRFFPAPYMYFNDIATVLQSFNPDFFHFGIGFATNEGVARIGSQLGVEYCDGAIAGYACLGANLDLILPDQGYHIGIFELFNGAISDIEQNGSINIYNMIYGGRPAFGLAWDYVPMPIEIRCTVAANTMDIFSNFEEFAPLLFLNSASTWHMKHNLVEFQTLDGRMAYGTIEEHYC